MAAKKNLKPAVKSAKDSWLEELLASSKSVAGTAKKLDFYREARREPPESLSHLLEEQERHLDGQVKKLLVERENLKSDVLGDVRFNDDALHEIEFSYQKAVCFTAGKKRGHSRMFFLPCVYWSKKSGETDGVIEFKGGKAQTFADFLAAFLDEHFGEGQVTTPQVTLYGESLKDWNVQDEEEKMLPLLHQSILDGKPVNLDNAFPARANVLARGDSEGWSVAVLPFAVEHDDEGWLESISFEGYEEEFIEGFEEIFDPSSKMDYQVPCDPTVMPDETVRHLWSKQLELTIAEMIALKKGKQIGVVETTYIWEEGQCVGVVMDFKVVDPHRPDEDDENDGVVYHRQMSRQTLIGETPGALSAFLVEYPSLMRDDFDLVFGHQTQLPEKP